MSRWSTAIAIAIAIGLLNDPAWSQSPGSAAAPGSVQGGDASPLQSPSGAALNYRLGPDDKVRVITYDEPQLTGEFSVDSSGNISLPLIGDVPAKGRTVGELSNDIEILLRQGYIKNPSVSVEVLTSRPFYILGEVNKPGEYQYTDKLTVMNAVATAGGYTYRANEKYAFIKHQNETNEIKTPVTASTAVEPGDTIRIGERYF